MGILIFADYPLYDSSSGSVPQIYYHRCTKDARDFFAMSIILVYECSLLNGMLGI